MAWLTCTTPLRLYRGSAVEPVYRPPPKIHTKTGSKLLLEVVLLFALDEFPRLGRMMLMLRQSSEMSKVVWYCMHEYPYWVASRTPSNDVLMLWGHRNLRSPTGGCAYGIPRKRSWSYSARYRPWYVPFLVVASSVDVETEINRTKVTAPSRGDHIVLENFRGLEPRKHRWAKVCVTLWKFSKS